MPAHCCCFGCKSRQEKGSTIKFFRIPKEESLRKRWIAAIRRENWEPTEHSRICSKHFIKGCPSRDENDPDIVPSLFSFTPLTKKSDKILQAKVDRHQRVTEREHTKKRTEAAEAILLLAQDENIAPGIATQTPVKTYCDSCTQTDISLPILLGILSTNNKFKHEIDSLKSDNEKIVNKNNSLSKEIKKMKELDILVKKIKVIENENISLNQRILSFETIKDSDKKIKFYTGIPNCETFMNVFETVSLHANRKKTKLDHKDELLITLIKLRRNLAVEDLAYRFDTSISQITKIFHRWLDALYVCLGGLVMWPTTDLMELPEVFQNERFRKVRCIIDCTEIFIERPSNLKARAQTYSNYKRHNTVKILVGVSPTGAIIFLSSCWGGRVSDKEITIESGLLDKLLPGDVVLADRGFQMEEEFAFKGAKLIVPAFTKGKKQLSSQEVEESRFMSRARIHVERVIGRLKDFEIIQGTLALSLVKCSSDKDCETTIDKIIQVIAAIINMNDRLL